MELCKLTIEEAIKGLEKKLFTPEELLNSCLDRIRKLNDKLNAFLTVVDKYEMHKKSGKLFGIPIALKDVYVTKGLRTTAASNVLKNYIPTYNATTVNRYLEEGAVIIGKTNQDAWAHGATGENSDFGPARNPWNPEYVAGGSSSGSAVAVAADMCLAAAGTDTGGSIRYPAGFCGVVGLKPTYGRVSRYGIIAMASSLDAIGHLTKTVYDNALVLNVTAGKDSLDATTSDVKTVDYTKNIKKGIKNLKVGVPKEYFIEGIDPKIKETVTKALLKIEDLGAEIIEISLPHTRYAIAVYYIVQPSEVCSNLARYDGIRYGFGRETFGDEAKRRIMLGTYTLSSGYYDAYYLNAMKVRTLIKDDFIKAFKSVNVIIAPVSSTLPFKIGEKKNDPLSTYLLDLYTATINLAGLPSLAIPCGFINNFPVGLQIIGPYFSEELLFQVGYAYEQVTGWYKKKPEL